MFFEVAELLTLAWFFIVTPLYERWGRSMVPVILFSYNRLNQLELTIDALLKNKHINETEIFIFSDGSKDQESYQDVEAVRNYLKKLSGFKSISIIEREKNYGLAKNIIEGVTQIIDQYKKVIVLEDDLVTSNNFLCFMNEALTFYQNDQQIFTVSGFTHALSSLDDCKKDNYISYRPSSWGWGIWQDR
jgi:glycosyltransferase involved in cell wall biosynthesis